MIFILFLLLSSVIYTKHTVKYSKRQQGYWKVTGLGSSSRADTLKGCNTTIKYKYQSTSLLLKEVNLLKMKLLKLKNKLKKRATVQ